MKISFPNQYVNKLIRVEMESYICLCNFSQNTDQKGGFWIGVYEAEFYLLTLQILTLSNLVQ